MIQISLKFPKSIGDAIVKYLLETSSENSRTWSAHLRNLSTKYDLADPLECVRSDPPTKSTYKEYILTKSKVNQHFEIPCSFVAFY